MTNNFYCVKQITDMKYQFCVALNAESDGM